MSNSSVPASQPPMLGLLLSVADVAERLDVSVKTIRRLIDSKSIAIHRIGRQIRISEADLAMYVKGQREA